MHVFVSISSLNLSVITGHKLFSKAHLSLGVVLWFSFHADNQLLRARVGIYNFRRPFIKIKFVKSHNKCPITSTLLTILLPLLHCFFIYLLPTFLCEPEISQTMFSCRYICSTLFFFDTIFSKILLVNSGDTETNPGPRKQHYQFSTLKQIIDWNHSILTKMTFL